MLVGGCRQAPSSAALTTSAAAGAADSYQLVDQLPPAPATTTQACRELTLVHHSDGCYLCARNGQCYHAARDANGSLYPVEYDHGQCHRLYYDRERDCYYRVAKVEGGRFYRHYCGERTARYYYDSCNYDRYRPASCDAEIKKPHHKGFNDAWLLAIPAAALAYVLLSDSHHHHHDRYYERDVIYAPAPRPAVVVVPQRRPDVIVVPQRRPDVVVWPQRRRDVVVVPQPRRDVVVVRQPARQQVVVVHQPPQRRVVVANGWPGPAAARHHDEREHEWRERQAHQVRVIQPQPAGPRFVRAPQPVRHQAAPVAVIHAHQYAPRADYAHQQHAAAAWTRPARTREVPHYQAAPRPAPQHILFRQEGRPRAAAPARGLRPVERVERHEGGHGGAGGSTMRGGGGGNGHEGGGHEGHGRGGQGHD
jgi:hypothetical protein